MKYFYNTVTMEYCGTDKPIGDNFSSTNIKPDLKPNEDESIVFDTSKKQWVLMKFEEPKTLEDKKSLLEYLKTLRMEKSVEALTLKELESPNYNEVLEEVKDLDEEITTLEEELEMRDE